MIDLRLLKSGILWSGAVALVSMPIMIAIDYGGVLRWTHYVTAIASFWIVVLALLSAIMPGNSVTIRQHQLLLPLLMWLGFSWFQTIDLSEHTVRRLSPASASAYDDWLDPLFPDQDVANTFPISVSRFDTLHAVAMLAVIMAISWASIVLLQERPKIILLLGAIALGVVCHAVYGIWRLRFPESAGVDRSFGCFINRNNAALLLNLGLGCSYGLLAWRTAALHGTRPRRSLRNWNELFDLLRDRDFSLGLLGTVVCLLALLVNGSRGGLLAALSGTIITVMVIRWRHRHLGSPLIIVTIIVCVATILIPLNLELQSVQRFDSLEHADTSFAGQGRLLHWRDSWQTIKAYLPAGSGLSTYAFAYLPFQRFSTGSWYHHADNLWLELFAEQGIVGIALTVAIFWLVLRALRRLDSSADPIDHGLRATGYFGLTAIAVSQLFDFGLVILANLVLVTVILSAIVARSSILGNRQSSTGSRRHRQGLGPAISRRRERLLIVPVAGLIIGLVGYALPRLKRDAEIEAAIRNTTQQLNAGTFQLEQLDALTEQLVGAATGQSSPIVLDSLAQLADRRGRLGEVWQANPQNEQEFAALYDATGSMIRRRAWLADRSQSRAPGSGNFPSQSTGEGSYADAFVWSRESLRHLPLGRQSRVQLLYLDFVPQDPKFTHDLLLQLSQLFSRQPDALVRIGRYAADSGLPEIATKAWRQALRISPSQADEVMTHVQQCPQIPAIDVLVNDQQAIRQLAPHLLRDPRTNRRALLMAQQNLDCEHDDTRSARSNCYEIAGDIAYALDQHDTAFQHYQRAIELKPNQQKLHLKLIARLTAQGYAQESDSAARAALDLFPDDDRFAVSSRDTDER